MKTYAIINEKGGVGKTTITQNLAYIKASQGKRTLMIDLDSQASLTSNCGIEPHNVADNNIVNIFYKDYKSSFLDLAVTVDSSGLDNLFIVPTDTTLKYAIEDLPFQFKTKKESYGVLKKHLKEVEEYFDFCFIDCAPSINGVSYNAFVAADEVIIPATPTYPAFRGLNTLSETLNMITRGHEWHGEKFPPLNPDLKVAGLIISMYQHTTVVDRQITQMYYDMGLYPVLGEIKKESVVEQDVIYHKSTAQRHPSKMCSTEMYDIAEKL